MTMIVLGKRLLPSGEPTAMLINRMKTASALFKDKFNPKRGDVMIVTGGRVQKGKGVPTEASVMKSLAVKCGVSAHCLVMEDQAKSTYDNATYSKDIMDYSGLIGSVTVITSDFHMNRGKTIFDAVFMNGEGKRFYQMQYHEDHPQLSPKELQLELGVEKKMIAKLQARLKGDGFLQ